MNTLSTVLYSIYSTLYSTLLYSTLLYSDNF